MTKNAKNQEVLNILKNHFERVKRADLGQPVITTLPEGCTTEMFKRLYKKLSKE